MPEAFGFVQNQKRADIAYFDGHQWQVSNRGDEIAGTTGTIVLSEGSSGRPVTLDTGAMLKVSRYSAMTVAGDSNAAIWATATDNGSLTQPVGIHGEATQVGAGDACGGYFVGSITAAASVSGGHNPIGFGGFAIGSTKLPAGTAIGFNPVVAVVSSKVYGGVTSGLFVQSLPLNTQTATVTFSVASPGQVNWTAHGFSVGHSLVFSGGTLPAALTAGTIYFVKVVTNANSFTIAATLGGAEINFADAGSGTVTGNAYTLTGGGVELETTDINHAQFDVGFGALANSVKNQTFRDDSSAVTSVDLRGSHTDGIDFSNGTFSGSQIKLLNGGTFTPTVTAETGTPTTTSSSGRWLSLGKFIYVSMSVTVTNHGTASARIKLALPNSLSVKTNGLVSLAAINVSDNKAVATQVFGANVFLNYYDGTTLWVDGNIIQCSGMVEVA